MSVEMFFIGILIVLLIGQQVYWARLTQKLTDKLMCRNYFEYAQVEKFKAQAPPRPETKQDDYLVDPEDERQAQTLNTLLGIV